MEKNDRELLIDIKNDFLGSKEILWKRYEKLVHKNWFILREQLQNSSLILRLKDDYYSEAYLSFEDALNACNLSKIYDDKWKFLGYFSFYLKNLRTMIINQVISTNKNEKGMYVKTEDGEVPVTDLSPFLVENNTQDPYSLFLMKEGDNNIKTALERCFSMWTSKQKLIYKRRSEGVLRQDIAAELGISAPTLTYHLNKMREDMEEALSYDVASYNN